MKVHYGEGLANHAGPESCGVFREEQAEALTGVRAGQAIEPRNQILQGAGAVQEAEGNIAGGASASRRGTLRGHGNHGMYGTFMRENREIPGPPPG